MSLNQINVRRLSGGNRNRGIGHHIKVLEARLKYMQAIKVPNSWDEDQILALETVLPVLRVHQQRQWEKSRAPEYFI